MNEAQFLRDLGYVPKNPPPHPHGLAAPCLCRDLGVRSKGTIFSPMIETPDQLDAQIDATKTLADRVLPVGRPGADWV